MAPITQAGSATCVTGSANVTFVTHVTHVTLKFKPSTTPLP
jgi:hypothetical protein